MIQTWGSGKTNRTGEPTVSIANRKRWWRVRFVAALCLGLYCLGIVRTPLCGQELAFPPQGSNPNAFSYAPAVSVPTLNQAPAYMPQSGPQDPWLPALPSQPNPPRVGNQDAAYRVLQVPPMNLDYSDRIQFQSNANSVTLIVRDAPLSHVLALIAQQHGLNIVSGEQMGQKVNVTLQNVSLEDALNSILAIHGFTWSRQNGVLLISSVESEKRLSPAVQGRLVRVFTLNYVMASDVDKVVKGLMSPVGQSFVNQTNKLDQRNAHEQLIIEDMPAYVDRIAQYIAQVDIMPRQVVVEANVLQVTLRDNNRHGVNFNQLARVSHAKVNFEAMGMASGSPTASALRVAGTDLTSLIEALKSTNDTKTLASPKVAVLNGQEARISVGGKLGYLLTTATNTSTLQSVSFLDYGVVLKVTPIITEDGRVLMNVAPQVSTGRINPTSKLPESEATEVETKVMLNDGEAIVIGGLIKETKSDAQNKIPWLGDLWLIGRIFQSRDRVRERNEIIITLVPRIARPGEYCTPDNNGDVEQARTLLMDESLNPVDRSMWEGELPDASQRKSRNWSWWRRSKADSTATVVPASAQSVVNSGEIQNGGDLPGIMMSDGAVATPNAMNGISSQGYNIAPNNGYGIPLGTNNSGMTIFPANENGIVNPGFGSSGVPNGAVPNNGAPVTFPANAFPPAAQSVPAIQYALPPQQLPVGTFPPAG